MAIIPEKKNPLTYAEELTHLFGSFDHHNSDFQSGGTGKRLRKGLCGPGVKVDERGVPLCMPLIEGGD